MLSMAKLRGITCYIIIIQTATIFRNCNKFKAFVESIFSKEKVKIIKTGQEAQASVFNQTTGNAGIRVQGRHGI